MNLRQTSKNCKRLFKERVIDQLPQYHVKWKHYSNYFLGIYGGNGILFYIEECPLLICHLKYSDTAWEQHTGVVSNYYIYANWRGCIDKFKVTCSPFVFYDGDYLKPILKEYDTKLPDLIRKYNDFMFDHTSSNQEIYDQMCSHVLHGFHGILEPTGLMLANFKKKYLDNETREGTMNFLYNLRKSENN